MKILVQFILSLSLLAFAGDDGEARLLRFPDIHEDKVTFVHAGDIYIVAAKGGTANRLTSHEGRELFPKFSPDGSQIAFSGEYNGTRQVYVIDSNGGRPRQLTFYNDVGNMPPRGGFDYQVLDWTPDGKQILFRGNRLPWGVRMGSYFTIPASGGTETELAVPEGGTAMFSPDGKSLVYTPISREFRTWKRHRGGRAQDVWTYDLAAGKSQRITEHPMTDNQPMWLGEMLYFTSDREFTLNIFAYDPTDQTLTKLTHHDNFDVLWPSADKRQIVYEHGGTLRRYDTATKTDLPIPVNIIGDFPETVPTIKDVSRSISGFDISPSGARAVFEARGDLYTVPAKDGEIRNISNSVGVRELSPTWSPDGKTIAYLSDRSGEYEIYVRSQDGNGSEKRIGDGDTVWMFPPLWSPDSSKIAFADKKQRLRIVNVADGVISDVDKGTYKNLTEFTWSADSKWLAYTKLAENRYSSIFAYSIDGSQSHRLTSDFTNDSNPCFSPDGKYFYFVSSRDFNLTFSGFEFDYIYTRPSRLYAVTMRPDVANPLAPKSDEEQAEEPDEETDDKEEKKNSKGKKAKGKEKKAEAAPSAPSLTVAGFEDRVFVLPIPSGNYGGLAATDKGLFFVGTGTGRSANLMFFNLKDMKDKTVLKSISGYVLAANGKKLLWRSRNSFGIIDAKGSASSKKKKLNLNGMSQRIDPTKEWAQIYEDAARLLRDWFYDPNMHGYDWPALVEKYRPLVADLHSRADLDFILGELGGELNAGHFYVNSGDYPQVDRKPGGLLGAEIVPDASGFYKIAHIFPGENWDPSFRNPLRDVGVQVNEGDFILAVDGLEITTAANFYSVMENKGNQVVTLLVNDKPQREGAREERVKTITRETNLRYLDWVASRKAYVEKASNGRIGYLHMPNTSTDGNRELFKNFYAQMHKDALIIDDRYNGGGFIPGTMIELLDRPVLSYWAQRGIEPFRTPGYTHTGPKACLINGYSSSGGDAFPYYFRKKGLGKLIGTRTWGGLIGLQGNPGFVDGGSLRIPVFRIFDEEGKWIIENEGVSPDMEVIDTPHLVAEGRDPSLEAAVTHLLEELDKNPPAAIATPKPPNESK